MSYTTVKISGVITQIAKITDMDGYTIGVLEIFFPDGHCRWSASKCNKWVKENNKRMESICNFLNKNKL